MAGWVATNVTAIFENVGVVQEGMHTIAVRGRCRTRRTRRRTARHPRRDPLRSRALRLRHRSAACCTISPSTSSRASASGWSAHSGAGKSTLVNLLLHFYQPESGKILIDGQDIATVTQESLRAQIAMVTQDTSLLHRSIRENIRYGRRWASEDEIVAAARQAEALEFIETLEDWNGRHGLDAHVGERGVKLSGGQRQRIAIARVILKNAPILILDEATSGARLRGRRRRSSRNSKR